MAALALLMAPLSYGQESDDEDEIFELSPFTVTSDDNEGYRATSTLAGTRLKTELKDVGSAISVITAEFMEDTGTTTVEDLLVHTVSTEIGGAVGNFAGTGIASDNEDGNSNARSSPQSNNRVRGLSTAAATRDYFLTPMGFDSYNTERVTISRGPNSILFGIGEPGGIIENKIKRAQLNSDDGRAQFRIGNRGSYRTTLDYNKVILEDRLSIRFMGMMEEINFKQKPTFEKDERFTIAATWKVLKNEESEFFEPTMIYANYEDVKVRGTPPNVMPPSDLYSTWWQPPGSPAADAMVGVDRGPDYAADYADRWVFDDFYKTDTTPGNKYASQPNIWNSYVVVYGDADTGLPGVGLMRDVEVIDGNLGGYDYDYPDGTRKTPTMPLRSSSNNPWRDYPGFKKLTIQNREVFDWMNYHIPGESQYANHDYDVYNVVLEQNMMNNNLGVKLTFDSQRKDTERHFPLGRAGYHSILIDTAMYKANGEPNPNLGRPMIAGMWDPEKFDFDERDTMQLTAYYNLDFTEQDGWTKHLGKYAFMGLLNDYERHTENGSWRLSWDDSHDPEQRFVQNQNKPGSWGGSMFFMTYVGDPQFDAETPDDLRLYQGYLNMQKPKVGDEYTNYYYDKVTKTLNYSTIRVQEFLQWPGGKHEELESKAYTVQGKFLDGHVSAIYGWREDDSTTYDIKNNDFRDPVTFAYTDDAYTYGWRKADGTTGMLSEADPVLEDTGDTTTTQFAAHMPDAWLDWTGEVVSSLSAHYVESENYNPANLRRDINDDVIPHKSGQTEEYGFTLGLFNDKALARFTWYETSIDNITNSNMQGDLWKLRWPIALAQRWTNAKNQSFQESGLQFEDYAWYGPNGAGPDKEGAVYIPERLGSFNSFDEVINAFQQSWPLNEEWNTRMEGEEGNQEFRWDTPQGMSTISSAISEGFEMELTYNIQKNWRMSFNVSKAESVFGNGLALEGPFVAEVTQNLKDLGLWGIADTPGEGGTVEGRWTNNAVQAYYSALSKENTVAQELRKWRWNAATNYTFNDGKFKGFGIGGALRWQDDVATGYPLIRNEVDVLVPDLDNAYFGGDSFNGDLWLSYKTKVSGDRLPLKLQLNFQNLIGDDDPIPVVTNPDGVLAIVRAPVEKRVFLTTTIDF
ncbi:TonB-dependent receptor plug domain-containing protein [Pelagicoccus mobilis]|uniref:TonB-dependent receptor plug domain-containing protein n=1 Tax=Pelagicoccus mobilis TaxID=415221 RepID=A0A934VNZ6_9BACT|nr:TonB-dependent receptor plug domain-containing protein [Pelagicoccus mobilis]MBK1875285.1 hypothetical protein [Pelagicoccus mobilis]